MTAAVLFPWRPGDPYRDNAAWWVMRQWFRHHQDIPTLDTGHLQKDGPWRKAVHVWHLTQASTADILVVSDVDCWVPPSAIRDAITAVTSGHAGWAVPHGDVHRLGPPATRALLTLDDATGMQPLWEVDLAEPPYPGHPGGGILVIRRDLALDIPPDPRFEGWGQEDDSWALALRTLAGPAWRGKAPLIHLWHPAPVRKNRNTGTRPGLNLYRRYQAAAGGTPGPMRTLTTEARDLLATPEAPN
jgi:hypothetical protein